jgi:hypothetical protein
VEEEAAEANNNDSLIIAHSLRLNKPPPRKPQKPPVKPL